jgi:hypothetical protein
MDDRLLPVPFWAIKDFRGVKIGFLHICGVERNSPWIEYRPLRLKDKPKAGAKSETTFLSKKSRIKPEYLPLAEKIWEERSKRMRANRKQDPTPGLLMGMIIYIDDKDPKNNFSVEMKGFI